MKILRVDSEQENRRKLERRVSDWKPMKGVDRRTEQKSDYSGSNRRKHDRRVANDRRERVININN